MAEPQKGASSTAHSKERTSLLDEEIGNEFLSSWKSATAGDDTLDFNCGTVSHGRKKPFDFDKLDMDFALDGGFEKISSFKIDMSDLDFSSPPRKTEKPKEKSGKESVLGRKERKQDRFTFSFDFTELDGFDLDSSLLNGEKKSDKNPGDIGLHTSVKPERGQDSMSNSATSVDTFENSDTSKLLPLDDATTSKFVLPKGVCGNMDTETNGAPSVSENLGNQNCLHDGTSPEKQITTFVQESKSECHKTVQHTEQSETTGSTEPCVLYAIQDTSSQPVSGDNSLLGTGPELQTGLSSLYAEVNTSPSRESDNSVKSVDNSQSKDSSPINSYNLQNSPATCITESKETHTEFQKYSTGPNHVAKENAIGEESARSSIGFGDAAMTSGSQKLNNATVVIENPYSVFKALLPLHRESTVGKPMPLKEKATGVIHSKYFNKSEDHESQLHSASTPRKASLCNKKLEGMHLGLANTKSPKFGGNEKQAGNHKVGISESNGRALIEAPVMGSEKNDKVLDTSGESTVDKPMPLKEKATSVIHSKYFGKSEVTESQLQSASALRKVSLCNKTLEGMHLSPANTKRPNFGGNEKQAAIHKVGISESTGRALKKAPVILGSEKNDKEINTSGFQVHTANLPEQTIISGTPKSSTPKFAVSNIEPRRDSKIISAEKHKKISLLRSDMKSFVFSGINITSAMASKSDSSNSTFQKEIKSLKQPEKNMGMLLTMASKMAPSVNTEKYALICPSLKRKSSEVPCPDPMNLNPLKRAIESYSESRNVQEVSQRIEEKMIPKIINPEDSYKSVCFDHPTPKLDVPLEASMTDFEVLTYIESDVNVEKAEACAKELDAICNMLKKKHNEAKEVLVRAIVNNNLLLMLNHPTYEEKISVGKINLCFLHHQNIHTIQRSAASMLSKEHQTRSN